MPVPSPRNPIRPARGLYADLNSNVASLSEGELVWATDENQFYVKESGVLVAAADSTTPNFVFIGQKADFPSPVGGVITLGAGVTYFIADEIDLTGDRLVAGANTTIIGGSSENCRLKSTGLTGTALLSSVYSLPLRHFTIEADIAINLDATGNADQALDWYGVNFTDCGSVGLVKNYSNFVIASCAFLNSACISFDGTIGTICIRNTLLSGSFGADLITLASTLEVTRRFRVIYSSVIALGSGFTAFRVEAGAIIPTEGFILDTVNATLVAGATAVEGLGSLAASNIALIKNCKGVQNTFVNGQMYMRGNVTATTIPATSTFYKVAGVTTASADNAKYLHANNRLTCDAIQSRKYLIQASLSFDSGQNNECEFGFYDSKLGAVREPSKVLSTANSSGRAENINTMCVVEHSAGDYIEIWCANNSSTSNITVENLNVVITEIGG